MPNKPPMPKRKSRSAAGLTLLQLRTVRDIARERGLELAERWESDRAFCTALLDHLAIDRRQRPLAEVVRFVNNLVRDVECGDTAPELARRYDLPPAFAETMHAYALKQLGYRDLAEWQSDFERLNAAIEDHDALA